MIAASGGNHGLAVAFAARKLGYHAEIFVPEVSTPIKVERLREYGAQVTQVGATFAEALAACKLRLAETGALFIHPYDQPEVIVGQGTLAVELEQQAPDLDTVLVAIGGGGLIAGIAAWYAGKVRVIGVEPVNAPSMYGALRVGGPIDTAVSGVAVDFPRRSSGWTACLRSCSSVR